MSNFSIKITDNSAIFKRAMEEREDAILEAFGIEAVKNTVLNITNEGRVDTGTYRNSFAWAVSGQQPTIDFLGDGRHKRTYGPDSTHAKTGKPVTAEEEQRLKHTYTGKAPKAESGHKAVYVGSALEYAPYQEEGYHTPNGTLVSGTHALRRGVEALQGKGKQIAEKIMKGGGTS